jgi:hypothetical protein
MSFVFFVRRMPSSPNGDAHALSNVRLCLTHESADFRSFHVTMTYLWDSGMYTGYTVDIVSLWSVFQKVRMDYLQTSSKPTRQELRPVCFPCGKSNVLDILIPFLYQGPALAAKQDQQFSEVVWGTHTITYTLHTYIYKYIYTACRAYINIKYPTCAKSISMIIIIIHLTIWVCHPKDPKVVSSLWFWALLVLDKRR